MQNKKMTLVDKISLGFIVVMAVLVLLLVIFFIVNASKSKTKESTPTERVAAATKAPLVVTSIVENEKYVQVEKSVTGKMVKEDINDMGVMITSEYDFTQVETYTKTKSVLNFITSESSFTYSYDGVVTAGVDFSKVEVETDDENGIIKIIVPRASLMQVDIDFESFKIYQEKEGIWNPLKLEDFNDSLVDFEKKAQEKAIEKGIIGKAQKQATNIIKNFAESMIDTDEYEIEVVVNSNKEEAHE